ncbi:hypothetical protein AOH259_04600 [Helicobacter pylori]
MALIESHKPQENPPMIVIFGGGIGAYSGAEIGDRVEDFIRGVDREPQTPREPTYDRHFVYDR